MSLKINIHKINCYFVTLLTIGKNRFAPGTMASIFTFLLFLFLIFLYKLLFYPTIYIKFPLFLFLSSFIILLSLSFISFFSVKEYIANMDNHDPKEVVIDEFLGFSYSLFIALFYFFVFTTQNYSLGYIILLAIISLVTFRIFDILKPFPVSYFDKMTGAFGVIMDDIVAGIISGILTICILNILF